MHLINVRTWRLEEFPGTDIPQYAVLSHTWDSEEVSFQDMQGWLIQFRKRFAKIRATCQQAIKDNIDYVWVDTCCIDKSSSAELTEAINSMFAYYRNAVVCYVLLSDLDPSIETNTGLPQCRWFTRGWTLQELIAPTEVRFYDSTWKFRGTTIDLLKAISRITHIRPDVLQWRAQPTDPLRLTFAAEKMSWVSHRKTTRTEDMAYCLLGIFNINMPLLYGEGAGAFRRLQEQILANHGDLSVLAWKPLDHEKITTPGVLARSAAEFEWIRESNLRFLEHCVPKECGLGSRGIHFTSRLCKYQQTGSGEQISPPYFLSVMDLGFWAERPDISTDRASRPSSPCLELVSVANNAATYSRMNTYSFGVVLRKYGPKLYCRDVAGPAKGLVELDPFPHQPKCPMETVFLYADRDYLPLAYWGVNTDKFPEVAIHFPKQQGLDIVGAASGAYWDLSKQLLLCWHDLSHISPDWDIITVRPSPTIYNTTDILLLVGPMWLAEHTSIYLLDEESEQTQYLLSHISELYGLRLSDHPKLNLAFDENQVLTTRDGKWHVSYSLTREIVEGISQQKVLCVRLLLSQVEGH
jgi:hypothetical protein